jgi:hypothetical protein
MTKRQIVITVIVAAGLIAAGLVYLGANLIETIKSAHGG